MDDAWQPDEFLAEFDSEAFDVEKHATEILRKGNINEEVKLRNFINWFRFTVYVISVLIIGDVCSFVCSFIR